MPEPNSLPFDLETPSIKRSLPQGEPRWLTGKGFVCKEGDAGSVAGSKRSLEKETATRSSILAGKCHGGGGAMPEEPGGS